MSKHSSSFVSNVLKLTTGSIFAYGLGMLVTPVITRLFAPEAFGIAGLFTSIASIFGALACLRYQLSIMLPKVDKEAANLLGVSLCFALTISAITAIIIFVAGDMVIRLLNSPELKKYLWLLPICVFVNGVSMALNSWNSRTKHFGRLSIVQVVSSITVRAITLIAGFAGYVSGGVLIGTNILGSIISTSLLGRLIWRDDSHLFRASIRWKKMMEGLKRYKKFPIFSTWAMLLNSVSVQLPIWILSFFFSPAVVGFFLLSRMVVTLPLNLVGSAVSQVFYQKAAEVNNRINELPKVVEEVFRRLISIGMFPALLMLLIGKDAFVIIFGTDWYEAGVYMQILSPWLLFAFVSSSMNTLFNVLERQRAFLVFNIILLFTRAIALTEGGLIGNPRLVVLFFSGTSFLMTTWMCGWLLSKSGVPATRGLYYLGKYTAYCLPMLGLVSLVKWGFMASPLGILIIGCLNVILYYAIILKQDEKLQKPVQILFQRF